MHLEREEAVRRRDKGALRDAAELVHESQLLCSAADMLDDGVREADVERLVGEREIAAVGLYHGHLWKRRRKRVEGGDPDGSDALGPGIESLEEVVRRA